MKSVSLIFLNERCGDWLVVVVATKLANRETVHTGSVAALQRVETALDRLADGKAGYRDWSLFKIYRSKRCVSQGHRQ